MKGLREHGESILLLLTPMTCGKKIKIKFQLKYMIKNNLKISHTSYEILKVNQTKKKIMRAKVFKDYRQLIFSCNIGLSTVMLEKV